MVVIHPTTTHTQWSYTPLHYTHNGHTPPTYNGHTPPTYDSHTPPTHNVHTPPTYDGWVLEIWPPSAQSTKSAVSSCLCEVSISGRLGLPISSCPSSSTLTFTGNALLLLLSIHSNACGGDHDAGGDDDAQGLQAGVCVLMMICVAHERGGYILSNNAYS